MPSAGIWKFVGPIAFLDFCRESRLYSRFRKRQVEIFHPIWAVAYAFVVYMICHVGDGLGCWVLAPKFPVSAFNQSLNNLSPRVKTDIMLAESMP